MSYTLTEALVQIARDRGYEMGDEPMIAESEWGWWVGGDVYVSKTELYSRYELT